MSDAYTEFMRLRMEMDLEWMRLEQEELADAEACGEEIYYDMSNAKERGYLGEDGETHTMLVGQYKRRKKGGTDG